MLVDGFSESRVASEDLIENFRVVALRLERFVGNWFSMDGVAITVLKLR